MGNQMLLNLLQLPQFQVKKHVFSLWLADFHQIIFKITLERFQYSSHNPMIEFRKCVFFLFFFAGSLLFALIFRKKSG